MWKKRNKCNKHSTICSNNEHIMQMLISLTHKPLE